LKSRRVVCPVIQKSSNGPRISLAGSSETRTFLAAPDLTRSKIPVSFPLSFAPDTRANRYRSYFKNAADRHGATTRLVTKTTTCAAKKHEIAISIMFRRRDTALRVSELYFSDRCRVV
jgi:hypothetical protein